MNGGLVDKTNLMSNSSITMEDATPSGASGLQTRLDLRKVSALTATALAVADMIGTGVFTSLGFQVRDIPSPFALAMLWIVGGTRRFERRAVLLRARGGLPAFGRRIQFLVPRFPALHRIHGRLDIGDGWLCSAYRFSGHGFRTIFRGSLRQERRFSLSGSGSRGLSRPCIFSGSTAAARYRTSPH